MFSVVMLAVVAIIGALAFGYFWWKTRALRQAMKAGMDSRARSSQEASGGEVFEGEAVVIEHARVLEHRISETEPPRRDVSP